MINCKSLAALKSERYFIGYEINEEYVKLAEKRIKSFTSQETMEF
ncbi:MAG: site-specific DNA-methyltransferase [Candidatus Kapabacteria bacterium]|nr:site-specific DNA-methyltransferase [Candidatus Kapabacteria bacterium]